MAGMIIFHAGGCKLQMIKRRLTRRKRRQGIVAFVHEPFVPEMVAAKNLVYIYIR